MVVMAFAFCEVVAQLAAVHDGHTIARIRTSLVECDGVKRSEHAYIRDDRHIVFAVAVAVRGNLRHDIDVETRAILQHGKRVFRDLFAERKFAAAAVVFDCVEVARADAATAADAKVVVDAGDFLCVIADCAVRTLLDALAAGFAHVAIDRGFAVAMLLHFACAGAAAHADVFQRAAKTSRLVALEVVERHEDIRVHDRLTNLRLFDVLGARQRNELFVEPLEPVGDDDLAAGGGHGKSVFCGGVEVLQRVFPSAGVEGVAVGQKRLAAFGADDVHHRAGEVRAQKRKVARLTEVNLDGNETILKIDALDTCFFNEPLKLYRQRAVKGCS